MFLRVFKALFFSLYILDTTFFRKVYIVVVVVVLFMKKSEARIILYINSVPIQKSYAALISIVLKSDYAYILRILSGMQRKGWLTKVSSPNVSFYYKITTESTIDEAKNLLVGGLT